MKGKTCFLVGAGSFDGMSIRPQPGDLVIAADGGYAHLKRLGIEPEVLLGDFDSLERVPEHSHIERHSPIKDDTDMALAAAYARAQGCTRFFLYGGLGGRLDHTLANLQLLAHLSRAGMEAYLIGEGKILTAATKERISFPAEAQGMLSVFCMGEKASGVWERGLKYELTDAVLTCERALGVSNEFTGRESSVSVKKGTLLLLWDEKNALPCRGSDYPKSYALFGVWLAFFAAVLGVYAVCEPQLPGLGTVKTLCLLVCVLLDLLFLLICATQSIYWINGVTYEEARQAEPSARRRCAYRHLRIFLAATAGYALYCIAAVQLGWITPIRDALVAGGLVCAAAVAALRIRLS